MKVVTGDLIALAKAGSFDVIIHGCNCWCAMGAGIAKTIKTEFPEAYTADLKTLKGDKSKLGAISFHQYPDLAVVNAYTQFAYWKNKGDDLFAPLVKYDAVKSCFKVIKKQFGDQNLRFGIPMIGAGLAGGDWGIISQIIEEEMKGEDLTLVEWIG